MNSVRGRELIGMDGMGMRMLEEGVLLLLVALLGGVSGRAWRCALNTWRRRHYGNKRCKICTDRSVRFGATLPRIHYRPSLIGLELVSFC